MQSTTFGQMERGVCIPYAKAVSKIKYTAGAVKLSLILIIYRPMQSENDCCHASN